MNLRKHRLPIAAGILLLSMSACGSSGKNATSSTTTTAPRASERTQVDAAFKARAAAVCNAAGDKLRAQGSFPFPNFDPEHPDASELPAIAGYEAKTVATERSWQTQLRALGQPSSGESAWISLLERIDRAVNEAAAQQAAAQHSNSIAFTKTFHELSSSVSSNRKLAAAVGLASCDPGALGSSDTQKPVPVRRP
jgi:hypothetical protein